MKVFIMRHGEAEHFAESDAQRALTSRGRLESDVVAMACAEQGFNHFDKVLVSPYLRAQQTWQAISHHFDAKTVQTCEDITPYGHADQVFDYLCALIEVEKPQHVLLVSHLPLVGYLTAEFVKDMPAPMFPTSGMVCIDFDPQTFRGEICFNLKA
ncbi:phosphohistidine phosphatase SixA [Vibrio navarrensis]|uniref:Phosphohistidine phosphatase n=1 Tax=Vibrio cidicii TaxID=1763883 RepID=A0A151JHA7_9VIBR|nr:MULTISPECIES: phosphohistidine phosphatase SixA [Vibrio]KGK09646.1 phosphohistidine phosphatase [Vibrio navarrensis]KGK22423.1 phosphohistidine phosphatase [Vibrio navarrensis]KYN25046.1 phosphohistidine phosphatase [Vibrio cidicii]